MNGTTKVRSPARPIRREFRGTPHEVTLARDFVQRHLPSSCPPTAVEEIALCVSEVTTNAIQHTRSGHDGRFAVLMDVEVATVHIEVYDGGPVDKPAYHGADEFDEGGRGLLLVGACARRFGYELTPRGGRTWFEYTWRRAVSDPCPPGPIAASADTATTAKAPEKANRTDGSGA